MRSFSKWHVVVLLMAVGVLLGLLRQEYARRVSAEQSRDFLWNGWMNEKRDHSNDVITLGKNNQLLWNGWSKDVLALKSAEDQITALRADLGVATNEAERARHEADVAWKYAKNVEAVAQSLITAIDSLPTNAPPASMGSDYLEKLRVEELQEESIEAQERAADALENLQDEIDPLNPLSPFFRNSVIHPIYVPPR